MNSIIKKENIEIFQEVFKQMINIEKLSESPNPRFIVDLHTLVHALEIEKNNINMEERLKIIEKSLQTIIKQLNK